MHALNPVRSLLSNGVNPVRNLACVFGVQTSNRVNQKQGLTTD